MKLVRLRSLLFICCFSILSLSYAENRHVHPKANENTAEVATTNKSMMPGYCQVEIINTSFDNVTVYGQFDDGSSVVPFNIYSFEGPHYISLFYYGYCHRDMYLDIVTFSGYHVYSGYTVTDSTVRIFPFLGKQVKAEVKKTK